MPNKKGPEVPDVPEADILIETDPMAGKKDCANCVPAEEDILRIIDNMDRAETLSVNGTTSIVSTGGQNMMIRGRATIVVIKEA